MVLPVITLLAWFAYYRHRTGFLFGNPEFLRYNATSTLSPLRVLLALMHRLLQVTAHMNMFVPVLCMAGALLLLPLRDLDGTVRPRISPAGQATVYVVLVANVLFFSVIGGALLTPVPAASLPPRTVDVRINVLPTCPVLVGARSTQRVRVCDGACS